MEREKNRAYKESTKDTTIWSTMSHKAHEDASHVDTLLSAVILHENGPGPSHQDTLSKQPEKDLQTKQGEEMALNNQHLDSKGLFTTRKNLK